MITVEFRNKQLLVKNDGEDIFISLEQQASLLLKANERLEADLSLYAENFTAHPYGHLAWAVTWREIRYDDLGGLILYYYIEELAVYSFQQFPGEKITLKGDLPAYFFRYMAERYPGNVSYNAKGVSLRERLKESFMPFKLISPAIKSVFKPAPAVRNNGIWLSAGVNIRKHRYRHLLGLIDSKQRMFYNNSYITSVKTEDFGISLNFAHFYRLGDFIRGAWDILGLKRKINTAKATGLIAEFMRSMPLSHIAGMRVKEIWVERAIKKSRPKAILYTTANTYPSARLMSRLAKLHNVPFIVVACRSMFTKLRPEERVCSIDLKEYNDARVADYHIVWDSFSKNTLVSLGIDKEKVFLAQNTSVQGSYEAHIKDRWLLLLTHEKAMNDRMLEALEAAMGDNKINVAYRTHPLQALTEGQLERLKRISDNLFDSSSTPMNRTLFENTVAITINSTAAIEAASYGCGILWMPYLNYRSVIFYDVMAVIGEIADHDSQLKQIINSLQGAEERQNLVSACLSSYEIHFRGENNADKLFQKLNIS